MKQEVESHLQEKEILESVIPSNIVIGPFWVNTENVRQALSKKRKALSNAVLELLAKKLRQQADGVSLLYFSSAAITMTTPDNVSVTRKWDGRLSEAMSPEVTNRRILLDLNMSHFAYACKMRCPLNLVLENSEYLWFY